MFETHKETTLAHFKYISYLSHNREKTHQIASKVASFTTCWSWSSNVAHIEQVTCYKMDSMSNFEFLLEIEDDDIENEHAF